MMPMARMGFTSIRLVRLSNKIFEMPHSLKLNPPGPDRFDKSNLADSTGN
jgi:hypothetical protein